MYVSKITRGYVDTPCSVFQCKDTQFSCHIISPEKTILVTLICRRIDISHVENFIDTNGLMSGLLAFILIFNVKSLRECEEKTCIPGFIDVLLN